MHLILLGPPGAGKGTQAVNLAKTTGLVHVATGDMFRENVRGGTELGVLAKQYMDKGELVPDDVTIRMLLDRLDRDDAEAGAMLDGFPRTVEQAHALDQALGTRCQQVDLVLLIDVSPEEVQRRLGGRWTCPEDGSVYHEANNPPQSAGKCDNCSTALIQRDDDEPEAIGRRLKVYEDQTSPLIEYYTTAGKLTAIDGERSTDAVGADLLKAVRV
jgi:adenylate kinase